MKENPNSIELRNLVYHIDEKTLDFVPVYDEEKKKLIIYIVDDKFAEHQKLNYNKSYNDILKAWGHDSNKFEINHLSFGDAVEYF